MRLQRLTAALAVAVVWPAAPAAALDPQPLVDVTPLNSELILCPADLGGGAGLAWQRFSEDASGGDIIDLSAAGLDPPSPRARLLPAGGCPTTATAASGASLIAVTRSGFATDDPGPVFVVDRAAAGPARPASAIAGSDIARAVTAALGRSGGALVAWKEEVAAGNGDEIAYAAARDGGAALGPRTALGPASRRVQALQAGVDDAGFGLVAWDQDVSARGGDARMVVATRAPGGAFAAPRPLGSISQMDSLSLAVAPGGEALLAVADAGGVKIATGTARDGLGPLRRLAADKATGVRVALSAGGAAAVAWMRSGADATPTGVVVSDRPAGGDFGAAHALAAQVSRPLAGDVALLRLAAAADGRALASWSVSVKSGDRAEAPVLVAAQRGADGSWGPAVAISGPCLQPVDAFPGFDRTGQPRVTLVQGGLISGGDYAFPHDTRVRLARLGGGAGSAPGPPPSVTLTARRRQVLRNDRINVRVRCALACDARVFSVIGGRSAAASGLFPAYGRLRPARAKTIALRRGDYFDRTGHALDREGRSVKVMLVVHACDSAGRLARARRTIVVRVPRRTTRRP